jgi:hypothetical protein
MRVDNQFLPKGYYFRDILSLPSITEEQKQPHDLKHNVDSSSDVWDEKLEKKLHKYGIKSTSVKIKPGQGIILPHGKYHCFKKIHHHEPSQNGDTIPLVSCACNASFIGIDNVWNNYQIIKVCLLSEYNNCQYHFIYCYRGAINFIRSSIHSMNLDSFVYSRYASQ